jgi:hypothetical protein
MFSFFFTVNQHKRPIAPLDCSSLIRHSLAQIYELIKTEFPDNSNVVYGKKKLNCSPQSWQLSTDTVGGG